MQQKIICSKGKCIDPSQLSCEERYENIVDIIECELIEEPLQ